MSMSQDDSVGKESKGTKGKRKSPRETEEKPTEVQSLEELLKRAENHETPKAKANGSESGLWKEMVVKLFETHEGKWFSAPQVYQYTGYETAKYWHDTLWAMAGGKTGSGKKAVISRHTEKKGLYGSIQNV